MPDYNPLGKKKDEDEKNDGTRAKKSKNSESESTYDFDLHQWINELIRAFRGSKE